MEHNQKMVKRPYTDGEIGSIILLMLFTGPFGLIMWYFISRKRNYVTLEEFNRIKLQTQIQFNEKQNQQLIEKRVQEELQKYIERQKQAEEYKKKIEENKISETEKQIQAKMEEFKRSPSFIEQEAKRRLRRQGYEFM